MGPSQVMKKAWDKARGGKVSGIKKGKVKRGKTKRRSKARPRTVIAREVHEVKRIGGISYTGGKVRISGTADIDKTKRQLLHKLGEQSGWLDAAISQAKTVRETNALKKKQRAVKAEMRKISLT